MSIQAGLNRLLGQAAGTLTTISAINARDQAAVAKSQAALAKEQSAFEKREALAMRRMQAAGNAKAKQRRRFADYMKNVETNFGTFKNLTPNLQKAVLADYSSAERRKIMNQMDRERKKL